MKSSQNHILMEKPSFVLFFLFFPEQTPWCALIRLKGSWIYFIPLSYSIWALVPSLFLGSKAQILMEPSFKVFFLFFFVSSIIDVPWWLVPLGRLVHTFTLHPPASGSWNFLCSLVSRLKS
jgi:hypothetical protein